MTHARLDRRPQASARAPWRAAAGVTLLGVVASGCMTSKVDETRQGASPIQANESIVLLKKPQLEGVGTEEAFLDCVQERLGGELVHPEKGQSAHSGKAARTAFKIYGEQEFTDALFPWFEPSTAPANAAIDSGTQVDRPNTMVKKPKAATKTKRMTPALSLMPNFARYSAMSTAPMPGAARNRPRPQGPTSRMSRA